MFNDDDDDDDIFRSGALWGVFRFGTHADPVTRPVHDQSAPELVDTTETLLDAFVRDTYAGDDERGTVAEALLPLVRNVLWFDMSPDRTSAAEWMGFPLEYSAFYPGDTGPILLRFCVYCARYLNGHDDTTDEFVLKPHDMFAAVLRALVVSRCGDPSATRELVRVIREWQHTEDMGIPDHPRFAYSSDESKAAKAAARAIRNIRAGVRLGVSAADPTAGIVRTRDVDTAQRLSSRIDWLLAHFAPRYAVTADCIHLAQLLMTAAVFPLSATIAATLPTERVIQALEPLRAPLEPKKSLAASTKSIIAAGGTLYAQTRGRKAAAMATMASAHTAAGKDDAHAKARVMSEDDDRVRPIESIRWPASVVDLPVYCIPVVALKALVRRRTWPFVDQADAFGCHLTQKVMFGAGMPMPFARMFITGDYTAVRHVSAIKGDRAVLGAATRLPRGKVFSMLGGASTYYAGRLWIALAAAVAGLTCELYPALTKDTFAYAIVNNARGDRTGSVEALRRVDRDFITSQTSAGYRSALDAAPSGDDIATRVEEPFRGIQAGAAAPVPLVFAADVDAMDEQQLAAFGSAGPDGGWDRSLRDFATYAGQVYPASELSSVRDVDGEAARVVGAFETKIAFDNDTELPVAVLPSLESDDGSAHADRVVDITGMEPLVMRAVRVLADKDAQDDDDARARDTNDVRDAVAIVVEKAGGGTRVADDARDTERGARAYIDLVTPGNINSAARAVDLAEQHVALWSPPEDGAPAVEYGDGALVADSAVTITRRTAPLSRYARAVYVPGTDGGRLVSADVDYHTAHAGQRTRVNSAVLFYYAVLNARLAQAAHRGGNIRLSAPGQWLPRFVKLPTDSDDDGDDDTTRTAVANACFSVEPWAGTSALYTSAEVAAGAPRADATVRVLDVNNAHADGRLIATKGDLADYVIAVFSRICVGVPTQAGAVGYRRPPEGNTSILSYHTVDDYGEWFNERERVRILGYDQMRAYERDTRMVLEETRTNGLEVLIDFYNEFGGDAAYAGKVDWLRLAVMIRSTLLVHLLTFHAAQRERLEIIEYPDAFKELIARSLYTKTPHIHASNANSSRFPANVRANDKARRWAMRKYPSAGGLAKDDDEFVFREAVPRLIPDLLFSADLSRVRVTPLNAREKRQTYMTHSQWHDSIADGSDGGSDRGGVFVVRDPLVAPSRRTEDADALSHSAASSSASSSSSSSAHGRGRLLPTATGPVAAAAGIAPALFINAAMTPAGAPDPDDAAREAESIIVDQHLRVYDVRGNALSVSDSEGYNVLVDASTLEDTAPRAVGVHDADSDSSGEEALAVDDDGTRLYPLAANAENGFIEIGDALCTKKFLARMRNAIVETLNIARETPNIVPDDIPWAPPDTSKGAPLRLVSQAALQRQYAAYCIAFYDAWRTACEFVEHVGTGEFRVFTRTTSGLKSFKKIIKANSEYDTAVRAIYASAEKARENIAIAEAALVHITEASGAITHAVGAKKLASVEINAAAAMMPDALRAIDNAKNRATTAADGVGGLHKAAEDAATDRPREAAEDAIMDGVQPHVRAFHSDRVDTSVDAIRHALATIELHDASAKREVATIRPIITDVKSSVKSLRNAADKIRSNDATWDPPDGPVDQPPIAAAWAPLLDAARGTKKDGQGQETIVPPRRGRRARVTAPFDNGGAPLTTTDAFIDAVRIVARADADVANAVAVLYDARSPFPTKSKEVFKGANNILKHATDQNTLFNNAMAMLARTAYVTIGQPGPALTRFMDVLGRWIALFRAVATAREIIEAAEPQNASTGDVSAHDEWEAQRTAMRDHDTAVTVRLRDVLGVWERAREGTNNRAPAILLADDAFTQVSHAGDDVYQAASAALAKFPAVISGWPVPKDLRTRKSRDGEITGIRDDDTRSFLPGVEVTSTKEFRQTVVAAHVLSLFGMAISGLPLDGKQRAIFIATMRVHPLDVAAARVAANFVATVESGPAVVELYMHNGSSVWLMLAPDKVSQRSHAMTTRKLTNVSDGRVIKAVIDARLKFRQEMRKRERAQKAPR